jgi:hypothetical protein
LRLATKPYGDNWHVEHYLAPPLNVPPPMDNVEQQVLKKYRIELFISGAKYNRSSGLARQTGRDVLGFSEGDVFHDFDPG